MARTLSNHGWQNQPISFRGTLRSNATLQLSKINLLLEQKKLIEEIAALGKDFIIVGRNADVILHEYAPFNVFVCAETSAKIKRCMERAQKGEELTEKELIHKMKEIDRTRSKTRELMSGSVWGQRDAYHLTVNTTDWDIKALVPAIKDFAERYFSQVK